MKPLWKVINICAHSRTYSTKYTYTYTFTYTYKSTFTYWWRRERREETNRTMSPSAVSLRIVETEQFYQVKRMIGGIGNVFLSTYSQTGNGYDPLVSLVDLWGQVMTIRGQILVSRIDDVPSVCGFKTSPCVRSKRHHVYGDHAYMFQRMCAWCRHTRGR